MVINTLPTHPIDNSKPDYPMSILGVLSIESLMMNLQLLKYVTPPRLDPHGNWK